MSERSGETLREWSDCLRWYENNGYLCREGDTAQLLDPLTGNALSSAEFAESILDDQVFGAGVEVLRSLKERDISIDLVFNYHRGVEDFAPLISKSGQVLEAAAVVGLEWNSHEDADIPRRLEDITWDEIAEDDTRMGSYIKATRDYVGIDRAVPCDIDYPSDVPGSLRHWVDQAYARSEQNLGGGELVHKANENIGYMVYQAWRNPMQLAMLGYNIGLHDIQRPLEDESSVAFVVGSAHAAALPARLEKLGVPTRVHTVLADSRENNLFADSTLHGQFSLTELETVIR